MNKIIKVIALMEGGRAPVGDSQIKLLDRLFPDRSKLDITLVGGPSWVNPAEIVNAIDKNTVIATIYQINGKYHSEHYVDRVDGKRLKQLKKMFAAAGPNENSWSVAMKFHDLETKRS